MTLTASEVASLTTAIDRWEYAEYVCTALVAVACFGEYIADFTDWWKHDGFWKWFGHPDHRKDGVAKFSTLVLIGALAGELLCVVITNQLSGKVVGALGDSAEEAFAKSGEALKNASTAVSQSNSSVRQSSTAIQESIKASEAASSALTVAREAHQEADSFEKDIKSAKKQASEAEAHLADAVSMAKAEEAELTKLATLLAPRIIRPDQLERIRVKLKALGPHEYTLWITPDIDSFSLMANLKDALDGADWTYVATGVISIGPAGIMVTDRVRIGVVKSRLGDLGPIAASITKALTDEGVDAVGPVTGSDLDRLPNAIHIIIGAKHQDR